MSAATPAPAAVPAGAPGPRSLAPIAGGSPEADDLALPGGGVVAGGGGDVADDGGSGGARSLPSPFEPVTLVALLFAGASVFFGIFPTPLFELAAHAGRALTGFF